MSTNSRNAYLLRTYGITQQQFEDLWTKQKSRCPVCTRAFADLPRRPHVDHDHSTGEIRGLLCGNCNHRVVGRHRDAALLARAARYLKGPWTGWFVPKKKRKRKSKR